MISNRAVGHLASHVGLTLGLRVVALLFAFAASVLTARLLGPALRGELAVMIAIPGLLAAAGLLGADGANLFFGGRHAGGHASVVRFSLLHGLIGGSAIAVAVWFLAVPVPGIRLGLGDLAFAAALTLTPIAILVSLLGTAEAARGGATFMTTITAAGMAIWFATVALISSQGVRSPAVLFMAFFGSQVLVAASLLARAWGPSGSSDFGWRTYASYALRNNLGALALLLLLRVDLPMIQALAGPGEVGLYSVVLPMAESLLLISTAINLVMLPGVASGEIKGDRAVSVAHLAMALAGLIAIGIGLAAPSFIPFLFGTAFAGSVPLLWVLLPGLVMFTAARSWHVYLLGVNNLRAPNLGAVVALATCVAGELILVPRIGAMGAAVSTTMSYGVYALIQSVAVSRVTGIPWRTVVSPAQASRTVTGTLRGYRGLSSRGQGE